ncbi:S1 RNA-binding domain-containing protein [Acidaminobacter hydrogenoformans]|uniref:S1 RNA binding domain protein n=1 Tax=Acidaminobacter hydrogenoformans DSM 2784 TaxID=1120920 RepID=A0A1G5RPS1_9FIRM|nr:S1 RNA-binding domain-containing protein [Acidaminobacter hydrogenoformans]SCZ76123.1 S1 RNA binding domain protein [Acidaminobacter hydrogenoformans DSM 2784]
MSAVEIGNIVDGVVTGITSFGAFIQLPDGKTGLCHISEIADSYVKNVSDFLKESQPVKVKIINIDDKGKVSLSIRQAMPKSENAPAAAQGQGYQGRPQGGSPRPQGSGPRPQGNAPRSQGYGNRSSDSGRDQRPGNRPSSPAPYHASKPQGFRSDRNSSGGGGFEDMLSSFIKDSDDKLKGIKKNAKSSRRGNGFSTKTK